MFILGCNNTTKEIDRLNLNFEKWKNDSFSCKNERCDIGDSIIKYKRKFIGLDSLEVVGYLGKPDVRYSDGDYSYYIAPNYHCGIANIDSGAVIIVVEFNWLHRVCSIGKAGEW